MGSFFSFIMDKLEDNIQKQKSYYMQQIENLNLTNGYYIYNFEYADYKTKDYLFRNKDMIHEYLIHIILLGRDFQSDPAHCIRCNCTFTYTDSFLSHIYKCFTTLCEDLREYYIRKKKKKGYTSWNANLLYTQEELKHPGRILEYDKAYCEAWKIFFQDNEVVQREGVQNIHEMNEMNEMKNRNDLKISKEVDISIFEEIEPGM